MHEERQSTLLEIHKDEINELAERVGLELSLRNQLLLLRYILTAPRNLDLQGKLLRKAQAYREENRKWLPDFSLLMDTEYAWQTDWEPPYHSATTQQLKRARIENLVPKFVEWTIYIKELTFWINMRRSLEANRVLKNILILDMKDLPLIVDVRFLKAFAESSNVSNFLHPQYVQKYVYVRIPRHFFTLMAIAKLILPKKMLGRSVFYPGDDMTSMPYLAEGADPHQLPAFLGGTCPLCKAQACSGQLDISVLRLILQPPREA